METNLEFLRRIHEFLNSIPDKNWTTGQFHRSVIIDNRLVEQSCVMGHLGYTIAGKQDDGIRLSDLFLLNFKCSVLSVNDGYRNCDDDTPKSRILHTIESIIAIEQEVSLREADKILEDVIKTESHESATVGQ